MSDEAKFQLVIAKLGKEVILQVTDLLITPPATDKYTALKKRLLSIYEESESRKVQRLIGELDLGEQKPSQLLRRMTDLARGKVSDDTLTIMWQNHLPQNVRSILAATESKDAATLAAVADRVLETMQPTPIAEVSHQKQDGVSQLVAEIQRLHIKIDEIERSRPHFRKSAYQHKKQGFYRSRSASREPTRRAKSPYKTTFCFYHHRFRERARKCVPPCTWKKDQGNEDRRG